MAYLDHDLAFFLFVILSFVFLSFFIFIFLFSPTLLLPGY
jgi:hypothetical protein